MIIVFKNRYLKTLSSIPRTSKIYFLITNKQKKLVDNNTFTYTYLLADPVTRDAVLIDPVYEKVERDLKLIDQLKLNLLFASKTSLLSKKRKNYFSNNKLLQSQHSCACRSHNGLGQTQKDEQKRQVNPWLGKQSQSGSFRQRRLTFANFVGFVEGIFTFNSIYSFSTKHR